MKKLNKPTTEPKTPKLVFIRWNDAQAFSGWRTIDETLAEEACEVWTAGWLLGESEFDYFVSTSIHEAQHNATMQVPKGCVISIKEIKY